MNPNHEDKVPHALQETVLHAIQGAIREEKQSLLIRVVKIVAATFICAAILGTPFLLSFRDQLTWSWGVAWAIWTLILLFGFSLHFHPQPRLIVSGVWSPFVLARLLIVATISVVFQILICPSFVFLSSPFEWNPMFPVTNALMRMGGMNLCMFFCGFFFSFVSGLLGLIVVSRAARAYRFSNMLPALALLLIAQLPILLVQAFSEELRTYLPAWITGLILATGFAATLVRLGKRTQ